MPVAPSDVELRQSVTSHLSRALTIAVQAVSFARCLVVTLSVVDLVLRTNSFHCNVIQVLVLGQFLDELWPCLADAFDGVEDVHLSVKTNGVKDVHDAAEDSATIDTV